MKTFFQSLMLLIILWDGRTTLISPSGRASLRRLGFDMQSDQQLPCAGPLRPDKCGICGHDFSGNRDRKTAGFHRRGTVAGTFVEGKNMVVTFFAPIAGFSEFRICSADDLDPEEEVSQACLNRNVLHLTEHREQTKYHIRQEKQTLHQVSLQLPPSFTCDHCVLQWTHTGVDSNKKCFKGKERMECKTPLTFRDCTHVSIEPSKRNIEGVDDGSKREHGDSLTLKLNKRLRKSRKNYSRALRSTKLQKAENQPTADYADLLPSIKLEEVHEQPKIGYSELLPSPMLASTNGKTYGTSDSDKKSHTFYGALKDSYNEQSEKLAAAHRHFETQPKLYGKDFDRFGASQISYYNIPTNSRQKHNAKHRTQIKHCLPTRTFFQVPGAVSWCLTNCNHVPANCPVTHCVCSLQDEQKECSPTPSYQQQPGLKEWCQANCNHEPPHCPANLCYCHKKQESSIGQPIPPEGIETTTAPSPPNFQTIEIFTINPLTFPYDFSTFEGNTDDAFTLPPTFIRKENP